MSLRRLLTLVRGVMGEVLPPAALPDSTDRVVRPIRAAPPIASPKELQAFFGQRKGGG